MSRILRVALAKPLRTLFDYLPIEEEAEQEGDERIEPRPGQRVRVPFRQGAEVGVIVEISERSTLDIKRLKRARQLLDHEPLLPAYLLALLRWAADYYHHPLGEVVVGTLPAPLRRGEPAQAPMPQRWRLSEAGTTLPPEQLRRAPAQAKLHSALLANDQGLSAEQLRQLHPNYHAPLRAMREKGWVEAHQSSCLEQRTAEPQHPPTLNPAQAEAVATIAQRLGRFAVHLLEGVTGSGKTEVYLRLIQRVIDADGQVLVLVPEIGLTPQLISRFRSRLDAPIALYHSALSDSERLCAWLAAASGEARVLLGTRSALFAPLPQLALIVIDEEHDLSLKQQEGFRYHARDLAIVRAQRAAVPIVLGSATPSLESLANVQRGLYQRSRLPARAGSAVAPRVEVIDVRRRPLVEGLSDRLIEAIAQHLEADEQVLLFINRRGFAPHFLCHLCGWVATCDHCDAHLTLHAGEAQLRCHHCGARQPPPPRCPSCGGDDLRAIGYGTERLEQALAARFPDHARVRIDRDTTRGRGAMEQKLDAVRRGDAGIMIGTQMLAKGHDLPRVTLVGVLGTDAGLFGADFRALEQTAQLLVQVAGRAGRAERPGRVLIQSHHPAHPGLQRLLEHGYPGLAEQLLSEREQAGLPPIGYLALIRAEAMEREPARELLLKVRDWAEAISAHETLAVECHGPVPAPMERRAGRFRAQLLLRASRRPALQQLLRQLMPRLDRAKGFGSVRWSLDVDPVTLV